MSTIIECQVHMSHHFETNQQLYCLPKTNEGNSFDIFEEAGITFVKTVKRNCWHRPFQPEVWEWSGLH